MDKHIHIYKCAECGHFNFIHEYIPGGKCEYCDAPLCSAKEIKDTEEEDNNG